jgi:phosphomannomutase
MRRFEARLTDRTTNQRGATGREAEDAPRPDVLSPPGIFKAYDIRGLYGSEMDESTAHAIGRAFARVLGRLRGRPPQDLRIGLGRDMRLTAPRMAEELRDGLIFEGATVLDAGMIATEMLYHLVGSRDLDGGAMVTASHNPKPYTGVKLVREGALALSGDAGIGDVQREIEAGLGHAPGGGSFEEVDIWDEFRRHALSFIEPDRVAPMKVVVDGGNGMAGPMVGPLLDELGMDVAPLYFEPDGEFPDHGPNPLLEENRRLIIERVRSEGADIGIAWDGDADRCFFIDDEGVFCDGDFVCALLARSVLEKQPGAMILYDPRSSRAVPDVVAAAGGRFALSRVGHAFFKARMREEGAAFGGEVSGHYYFHDFWCADSGTIPALMMLELVSVHGRRPSQLMAEFRSRYFISGEINSEVADQTAKMEQIAERYSDAEITRLDGVSIEYPDWHFNVRPSNTEPLLRVNLESLVSPEHMEQKRDEVLGLIRS